MHTNSGASNVEYPMFVFATGHKRDAIVTPTQYSTTLDVDYVNQDGDSDFIETEEFEIL